MQQISNYLGELIIVIGTAIATYNIFGFSYLHLTTSSGLLDLSLFSEEPIYGVAYYYSDTNLLFITLGVTMVVVGMLLMKNKK